MQLTNLMRRILIVEDDKILRTTLVDLIEVKGYRVTDVGSAEEAINLIRDNWYDIIISDIALPQKSGIDLLRAVKAISSDTEIILITGHATLESSMKALKYGAYDYLLKPFDSKELLEIIQRALEAGRLRIENEELIQVLASANEELLEYQTKSEKKIATKYKELQKNTLDMMKKFITIFEAENVYWAGHSERVENYSILIAVQLNIPVDEMIKLKNAAALHDIGKVFLESHYFKIAKTLNEEEWKRIQLHPILTEKLLEPFPFLKESAFMARHHHEREDGKGYPDGLKSNELTISEKILIVADAYDAISSRRPYRKKELSIVQIKKELIDNAGTQFDPKVLEVLLNMF